MRILFLTHYFPPEVNAPAGRTFEHCRAWARSGHSVGVLTNVPNHPLGKVFDGYENRLAQAEQVAGITVYRQWTFVTPNKGIVRRSISYFLYLVVATIVAPWLPRADVIVSTSPQFFCGLAGFFVSRIKRAPWILEIRDLWPESIVAVGAVNRSWSLRWLAALARFAYRKADRIVCVTDAFREAIAAEGVDRGKIVVIKNGVDLDFFAPERLGAEASVPGLPDTRGKFVVSYVGTHGMAHGLDTVLEAAELLRDCADVLFVMVGDGAERERLRKKRDMMRLNNVVMLEQQPKAMMPAIWAITDVSMVLLRDQPLFRTVIPSKIFESMAMRKPIILGVRGESQELVGASQAGVCIQPESAMQLARSVRALRDDPEQREAMGLAGRQFVEANFDRQVLAERFENVMTAVVDARQRRASSTVPP